MKKRHQGEADRSPAERVAAERRLLRQVDRVVATCSDEVDELVALGADASRVSVVPCGYDDGVFCPSGPQVARGGRRRVVCVSRLVARKGLADVVRALPLLDDVELVVAGGPPSPDHLRDDHAVELVDLAERLGVGDRPRAPRRDRSGRGRGARPVRRLFRVGPLVRAVRASCARGGDGVRCPVVASRVGGMLDTVVDGGTGALVPPRDPRALAQAIRWFLDDPVRSRQCGERAAWRARRRYAWARRRPVDGPSVRRGAPCC